MDLFFAVASTVVEVARHIDFSDDSKKSVISSAFDAENSEEAKALSKKREEEAKEYYKREYIDRGRKDTLTSYSEYDRDSRGRVISKRTYRVDYKK